MNIRHFFRLLSLLGLTGTAFASEKELVSFTFYHFPPKMVIEGDRMSGERFDEMNKIAEEAGYSVNWIKTSLREEGDMLDAGRRAFCATGRAFTYDRADRWVFLPYVQDELPPVIFVTRLGVAGIIRSHASSEAVLHDENLRGSFLENFVYGAEIDRFLETKPAWIIQPAADVFQVIDMVRIRRADYTMVPTHNWRAYIRERGGETGDLLAIDAPDLQFSRRIYLVCSKATSTTVRDRLGAAMRRLGYPMATLD